MTWLFLCILLFVRKSQLGSWTAAFQPIHQISRSLALCHEPDVSLSDLELKGQMLRDPRSVPLLMSSSSDSTDSKDLQYKWQKKLEDTFDRWRFLQKLLDDDINDADDILFVLQACIQQSYQRLQSTPSRLATIHQSQNLTSSMASAVASPADVLSPLSFDDTDGLIEERLDIMSFILQEKSSATINRLLQALENDSAPSSAYTPQDFRFLDQLERLLPDPALDEDAAKGLWDTVIELHGRESVRINEQQKTMNWRTRCLIARVLIFYDFLSAGIHSKIA
jgi:hypothetical protein